MAKGKRVRVKTDQRGATVRGARTILMLSAGAPHSPLMAGALCAFVEEKISFDIIYTSGAGALVGLLFVAPKEKSSTDALRGLVDLGISDLIYRFLPINYKAFLKPGRFTKPIHQFAQHFKLGEFQFARIARSQRQLSPADQFKQNVDTVIDAVEMRLERRIDGFRRLYNDLVDLWAAAITPIPPPSYWSKGLCAPLPFLEDLVDFGKLKAFKPEFYVNAFNPQIARERLAREQLKPERSGTGSGMMLFSRDQIGPDQVRAAFAYPFIYSPVKIDGTLYFEGADLDPIGFGHLMRLIGMNRDDGTPIHGGGAGKTIVLIDILASLSRYLLREPRNLWDAFGISIMMPVVAHAQNEMARFERRRATDRPRAPKFLKLPFKIPEEVGPHVTDWSYSNMSRLFEIGLEAGRKFLAGDGKGLPRA